MSAAISLAQRMKSYEYDRRTILPRRSYVVLRMDGSNFKTYTRDLDKPFDAGFGEDMKFAAEKLCARLSGSASFAYVASDEISVLLTDFATEETGAWYGGVEPKMISIAASYTTAAFNAARAARGIDYLMATFDARVVVLPDAIEVANYFLWRQRDIVRNSISMAAHEHLTSDMHGLKTYERVALLKSEAGIDWDAYPEWAKRGSVVSRVPEVGEATYVDGRTGETETTEKERYLWDISDAPEFKVGADEWLDRHIPDRLGADEASLRCPHPAKERYRTLERAQHALARIEEKFGAQKDSHLHPYECSCGFHHLGRRSATWLRWNKEEVENVD